MLKIEVKRGNAFEDITNSVRVAGCEINYKFGTDDFMYAPDIMDFSIKVTEDSLINYFLHQHLPVEVLATDDENGQTYFNGYIKPSNQISIEDDYGELNLHCEESIGIDLKRPCPRIVEIDTDLQTIAITLVTHANLQFNFPPEMSDIIVPYFILEEDETTTLDALDKLLWEYGYTMYQDHNQQKIVSARSWFFLVEDADVHTDNVFDVDTDMKILEPLEINEEEIEQQIQSVDWIVASNINRVEDDNDCNRGAQLYLHPRSTSDKGVASILADSVWPPDGHLIPTYFRYGSNALPDIIDSSRERIKIIHAFNQCIQYVGETDDIVLELQEHSSKRSRLVFRNNAAEAVRLRGFLIRGSAIYSQGTYTVLGGIYTEPFEFTSGAVTRSMNSVTYLLPMEASDQDGFYVGWNLLSENGTNVKVVDYDGISRTVTTREPMKVSTQDIMGTEIILLSPDIGLTDDKYEAEHLYNDLDAKKLCLALINLVEFGRYTYSFDLKYSTIDTQTGNPLSLQSSVINGRQIRMIYNNLLDENTVPDVSAFTVMVGTLGRIVSSVAIVSKTVLVYLSSPVNANDTITIAYSRPADDAIEDREGNLAPSFTSRQLTNETNVETDNQIPELRHASIVHNIITLTYDKILNASFTPPNSAYAVTEDGEDRTITNVRINLRQIIVNISPPARIGTRIELSYEVPTTNGIRDLNGNLAEYILNQWVSNQSILESQSVTFE